MMRWALASVLGSLLAVVLLGPSHAPASGVRPNFDHVHALAFDADGRTLWRRPTDVYAATMDGRMFLSRDGGATWDARR